MFLELGYFDPPQTPGTQLAEPLAINYPACTT